MSNVKRLLIVDDSEIDRCVLKNILNRCFEVVEAESGLTALEIITKKNMRIDGILLDISMPFLDGFNVLDIMEDNNIRIPIVLVTAEATIENVQRGAKHDIKDFIKKPFDAKVILEKMEHIFGFDNMFSVSDAHKESLPQAASNELEDYISRLSFVFREFLKNIGLDDSHYKRVAMLMQIMLVEYSLANRTGLDTHEINLISEAAYFHDIGLMGIPTELILKEEPATETEREIYHSHTVIGANIVRLCSSGKCDFFVDVCSDMCMHHHARFDKFGFPNNSVYGQLCGLADRFDLLFTKRRDIDASQFDFIISELKIDRGAFSPVLTDVLLHCKGEVLRYYKTHGKKDLIKV